MSTAIPNLLRVSSSSAWWALPLRIVIGYGFFAHGLAKLERGPDHFAGVLDALGMPAAHLLAWATIAVEILGGIAVILGLAIPLVSAPMIVVLLVAIVTVHLPNGFSSIKLQAVVDGTPRFGQPGYETDLLYIAGLVSLVFGGAGPLALGPWISGALGTRRPAQADGTAGERSGV